MRVPHSSRTLRLVGFIAGNVINDGNGNQPTYDAENTIATVAGVTYDYDADGVRVEKSSGTMTLRDQRPYLKQYNTGAGGPANSPNPQGGIIIKK